MKTLNLVQRSPEWAAVRATHFTASEAPAMMGFSKFKTRSGLLREKATGLVADVDGATQARFNAGHAAEEAARPIVDAILNTELFPITARIEIDGLNLLASFDGVSMDETVVWENKLKNSNNTDLAQAINTEHWPQLEQQALVAGLDRVYFTVSDGTVEGTLGLWYVSETDRRQRLLAGWCQFAEDLKNYQPPVGEPEAIAAPIQALPALLVQIEGKVLATNLNAFRSKALTFIEGIKTDLSTDQDFVDADKMGKFLKDGEDRLDMVKRQALAQTASIDALFRALDEIHDEMRNKRLMLERLVKIRKESIRREIEQSGRMAFAEHVTKLNTRLGCAYMPVMPVDFAGVMRGLKTITSLRNAVDTELARVKIVANETADRIEINMNSLRDLAADYKFLFADTAQIVLKENGDLTALVKMRIAEHKEAEAQKAEQERTRQEVARQPSAVASAPPPVMPAGVIPANELKRPSDVEIIDVLVRHFGVNQGTVVGWLRSMFAQ